MYGDNSSNQFDHHGEMFLLRLHISPINGLTLVPVFMVDGYDLY